LPASRLCGVAPAGVCWGSLSAARGDPYAKGAQEETLRLGRSSPRLLMSDGVPEKGWCCLGENVALSPDLDERGEEYNTRGDFRPALPRLGDCSRCISHSCREPTTGCTSHDAPEPFLSGRLLYVRLSTCAALSPVESSAGICHQKDSKFENKRSAGSAWCSLSTCFPSLAIGNTCTCNKASAGNAEKMASTRGIPGPLQRHAFASTGSMAEARSCTRAWRHRVADECA
jgi:hypothetical protein